LNDKNLHIDNNINENQIDDFFGRTEVVYSESKEDIWNQLESQLEKPSTTSKLIKLTTVWVSAAAVIILLFGLVLFLKLYTKNVQTHVAEQIVHNLPDGSEINLYAGSSISYHPYWWFVSRELNFEGEAFFSIAKGSNFTIVSQKGTVEILGTSFNILSRNNKYNVACYTGKVRVTSNNNNQVILTSDYQAKIADNGTISVSKFDGKINNRDLLKNMFSFTSVPLIEVLKEVERQYDVKIYSNISSELIYTGHFSSNRNVMEVIDLLCKPFGLKVEKISKKEYRLK